MSDLLESPWKDYFWPRKISEKFRKLESKKPRLMALLRKGVENLVANKSTNNIGPVKGKGLSNVKKLTIDKDGGIRIYFKKHGGKTFLLTFGEKRSQERDIAWLQDYLKNHTLTDQHTNLLEKRDGQPPHHTHG